MREKVHKRVDVTKLQPSATGATDIWFQQQRQRENEERERRVEAVTNLHEFRGDANSPKNNKIAKRESPGGTRKERAGNSNEESLENSTLLETTVDGALPKVSPPSTARSDAGVLSEEMGEVKDSKASFGQNSENLVDHREQSSLEASSDAIKEIEPLQQIAGNIASVDTKTSLDILLPDVKETTAEEGGEEFPGKCTRDLQSSVGPTGSRTVRSCSVAKSRSLNFQDNTPSASQSRSLNFDDTREDKTPSKDEEDWSLFHEVTLSAAGHALALAVAYGLTNQLHKLFFKSK
jgi:hypothetical protein